MNHHVDPLQRGGDSWRVTYVADHEVRTHRAESLTCRLGSIAVDVRPQRIENYDPVRPGNELRDDLLSDEPGSAGHEYAHPVTLSRRWPGRKQQLVVCPLRPGAQRADHDR